MIDFDAKVIHPMLIGASGDAFDSADYIYELKWDGERCIAYLDPKTGTELRNKRNLKMLSKVPELTHLHKQVKARCILSCFQNNILPALYLSIFYITKTGI